MGLDSLPPFLFPPKSLEKDPISPIFGGAPAPFGFPTRESTGAGENVQPFFRVFLLFPSSGPVLILR